MLEMLEDSAELKKDISDKKIEFEKRRIFDQHFNPLDYSNCIPVDENFDYLRKGPINAIKKIKAQLILRKLEKEADAKLKFEVIGKENLKSVKMGAILTSNHFNKIDSFGIRTVLKGKLHTISGDYNNYKGVVGDIARFSGLIPISNKKSVMKKADSAISYLLKHKKFILIYPEASMWWNFEKPRPLHNGAFHWAVKNNVPVVPVFTTFRDSGNFDKDGYEDKFWTVNILKPIYPDKSLTQKEQIEKMKEQNFEEWKECYEKTYNKKLEYI